MGDEDLEAVHDLCKRNSLVLLPVFDGLCRLYKDDIVVVVALQVDLGLRSVSAGHDVSEEVLKSRIRDWISEDAIVISTVSIEASLISISI